MITFEELKPAYIEAQRSHPILINDATAALKRWRAVAAGMKRTTKWQWEVFPDGEVSVMHLQVFTSPDVLADGDRRVYAITPVLQDFGFPRKSATRNGTIKRVGPLVPSLLVILEDSVAIANWIGDGIQVTGAIPFAHLPETIPVKVKLELFDTPPGIQWVIDDGDGDPLVCTFVLPDMHPKNAKDLQETLTVHGPVKAWLES